MLYIASKKICCLASRLHILSIPHMLQSYCKAGRRQGAPRSGRQSRNDGFLHTQKDDRDFRRQSVGQDLLAFICEYGRNHPCISWIDLEVLDSNQPAKRLYEKMGFTTLGLTKDMVRIAGVSYDCASPGNAAGLFTSPGFLIIFAAVPSGAAERWGSRFQQGACAMAKYGLNKVTLIGNLGQDPEYRQLDNGVSVARINLACTESFPDRSTGASVDKTEWFRVTLWRSNADVAHRYLRKGSAVFIEGRLRNHSWDTPQGEKRYSIEIDAVRMILLDRAPEGGGPAAPFPSDPSLAASPASYGFGSPAAPSAPASAPPEDDLPF